MVPRTLLLYLLAAACDFGAAAVVTAAALAATDRNVFRANDTLLGKSVACSDAEKECLRYNRLLHAASGRCVRVGSRGPCAHPDVFLLDREAFEKRGRLEGACADPGRCPGGRFRMALDGRCYAADQVFGTFCDVRAGASAWPYFFGGYECVCDGAGCPSPRYVSQPDEQGQCRFPNFRKDLSSGFFPRLPEHALTCSAAQSWCFGNGQVAFGDDGKCYGLLERGPCPAKQHLVLDRQQAIRHRKIAVLCVPVERCPTGFRIMTQRLRCVNETKVKNVMCPELSVFTDVFGETVCKFEEEDYKLELTSPKSGLCKLRYNVHPKDVEERIEPECTDPLECLPIEVISLDNQIGPMVMD